MNSVIINKEDLKYNIEKIKEYAGINGLNDNGEKVKIIAAIKSNGYGLGVAEYARFLKENGIDFFAVSNLDEAIKIRKVGIEDSILMLESTALEDEVEELLKNNIIVTVGSKESAETLEKVAKKLDIVAKAHIKIDTGFGRYGFIYTNKEKIVEIIKGMQNIEICGTYTHFSNSYYDEKGTKEQFKRFIDCIEVLKMNKIEPGMLHVCNTSAFLRFPNMHLNAVRVGSAFLGKIVVKDPINLRKIGQLKSNIIEIKELPKNFNVGYSNIYKTTKKTRIAIVPCGLVDGFNIKEAEDMFRLVDRIRRFKNSFKQLFRAQNLKVKINGKDYNIIGRIGTHHITIDITGGDAKIGDEVILDSNIKYVDSYVRREWK